MAKSHNKHLTSRTDGIILFPLAEYRGVAQLAAHRVWDAGAGGSSPPTPTDKTARRKVGGFIFFSTKRNVLLFPVQALIQLINGEMAVKLEKK